MSLLGKLFVVIMLLMSVLFLGVSATLYSQRADWRMAYKGLQTEYTQMVKQKNDDLESVANANEQMRKSNSTLQSEVSSLLHHINVMGKETQQLKVRNADLQARLTPIETSLSTISQNMDNYVQKVELLQAQNTELTDQKHELSKHNDNLASQVARLYNELTAMKANVQQLKEDLVASRKAAEDKQLILDRLRIAGIIPEQIIAGIPPTPKIEATVVAVKADIDPPMVLINKGKDDKVKPGYIFAIHKDGRLKGRVVIEQVMPRYSAGRVTIEEATIDAHDHASTWLE